MKLHRPGLLVSVRNATEAVAALAGGADLIDVKEPSRGALGAADAAVWNEVLHVVAGGAPVSAALGELLDREVFTRAAAAGGLRFAKFGLAGCGRRRDWRLLWQAAVDALPPGVLAVPAAYADWRAAAALPPPAVLELARQSPARLLLIDTWEKSGRTLFDALTFAALETISRAAADCGVQLVLAGSLSLAAIERLLPLAPAYVGVRGAACRGGRNGKIDTALVKTLAEIVIRPPHKAAG